MLTAISDGESATDSPWHTGQRRSAATSLVRASSGPSSSRAPRGAPTIVDGSAAGVCAPAETARPTRSATARRSPLMARGAGAARPASPARERPLHLSTMVPSGVDEVGLGHARDAVGDGGAAARIDERRVGAALALQELRDALLLVLVDDAVGTRTSRCAAAVRFSTGMLLEAGHAPGRPEVEHDRPPAQRFQADGRAAADRHHARRAAPDGRRAASAPRAGRGRGSGPAPPGAAPRRRGQPRAPAGSDPCGPPQGRGGRAHALAGRLRGRGRHGGRRPLRGTAARARAPPGLRAPSPRPPPRSRRPSG